MMKQCRENGFEYLFTHKESHQKELDESYRTYIREKDYEEVQIRSMEQGKAVFVNHVEKASGKTETVNIFEYSYEKESKNGEKKEVRFCWITSMELTKKNIEKMVKNARGRWKIEKVAIKEKKKNNQISTNIYVRTSHIMTVWITFLKNQRNVFDYQQTVENRKRVKIK